MSRHSRSCALCLLLIGALLWPSLVGASPTPTLTPEPPSAPEVTPYPPLPTGSPDATGYPEPTQGTPTATATVVDGSITPMTTPTLTVTPQAHRLVRLPLILRLGTTVPVPTETPTASWQMQMLPLVLRT